MEVKTINLEKERAIEDLFETIASIFGDVTGEKIEINEGDKEDSKIYSDIDDLFMKQSLQGKMSTVETLLSYVFNKMLIDNTTLSKQNEMLQKEINSLKITNAGLENIIEKLKGAENNVNS